MAAVRLGRFGFRRRAFLKQPCDLREEFRRRYAFGEQQIYVLISWRQIHQASQENDGDFGLKPFHCGCEFSTRRIGQQMVGNDQVNVITAE